MSVQGRFFRPKLKSLIGTPYDSNTEKIVHETMPSMEFKPQPLTYVVKHKYYPDFKASLETGSSTKILLVEVKGYFQEASEAAKYVWVRESLPPDTELVFIFEKPDTACHWLKKRKDGTKQTMAEWAERNGFRWFTLETFKESFHNE
ncbi:endodeoxyribonuclease I [Pseudomonas phage Ka1]|nr:endodeoxyribonuclease I [Pseudomonas phage Ka1]